MEDEKCNRNRIIGLRLTVKEYERVERKCKATTCRTLSDYVRKTIFEKPVTTLHRDASLDDFMTEAVKVRNTLNGVANNFNQAVKKLNTLQQIQEFRHWISTYETDKNILISKVEDTKNLIQKIGEKWLR